MAAIQKGYRLHSMDEKTMIFVEVKRKNEKLSPQQIEWGEYLIKTKIPYKIVRVVGYVYNPAY